MRTSGAVRVLVVAAALTVGGVALAVPATADQQVVNPARCAAQGGTYKLAGTSRSCTVVTGTTVQNAIQFLDGPVSTTGTAAYIQIATTTSMTTTTTGAATTSSTSQVTALVPGSATCATGTILNIVDHAATPIDCASVGLPDPNLNGPNPIFILS